MSEPLLLPDRIQNLIKLRESHFREFKSAVEGPPGAKKKRSWARICQDIGEALVAFANADGGELLVGVEDDGTITGVPHAPDEIEKMLAAPTTHVHAQTPVPLNAATTLTIDEKTILFFSVLKGSTEIYQLPDGRCVRRKDKATIPENFKQIQFDRQEVRSREYDRQFVDGAGVDELDLDLLRPTAESYLRGFSVELYLQQMGLAEYGLHGLQLRMATLLLFAKDSRLRHPRSQIRILKVRGTELKAGDQYNVLSDDTIQGNIFQLLRQGWERLRGFLVTRTQLASDARFEPSYIYPERACQEALINAIAHRDYSRENGIDVFLFDDRMEIRSPGPLLSPLSIGDLESLEGAHESRNAFIARVLRENQFMRELGEGMRRIFDAMEERELERPKLYSNGTSFTVTLYNKSIYSSKQEAWLSSFASFGALTRHQKGIIVAGMEGRELSTEDIREALQSNDRNVYDSAVTPLRQAGILDQVRSNAAVSRLAKNSSIPRDKVPKFKVQPPSSNAPPPAPEAPETVLPTRSLIDLGPYEEGRTIVVHGMGSAVTEDDLRSHFQGCGPIRRVYLGLTETGGRFGFVEFDGAAGAKRALEQLSGRLLRGAPLSLKRYSRVRHPSE